MKLLITFLLCALTACGGPAFDGFAADQALATAGQGGDQVVPDGGDSGAGSTAGVAGSVSGSSGSAGQGSAGASGGTGGASEGGAGSASSAGESGTAGASGTGNCTPLSCRNLTTGEVYCGKLTNVCGEELDCGTSCNGAGSCGTPSDPHLCSVTCKQPRCIDQRGAFVCGVQSNACGDQIDCGIVFMCDGGPWQTTLVGNLSQWLGVSIGGASATSYRADVDVAEVFAYEGQLLATERTSVWSYFHDRYPSLALPASSPAEVSTVATVASGVTLPSDFDFIVIGGQSQNSNYTSAGILTFASNVYELGNDNIYKLAISKYDDPTNSADLISLDPPNNIKPYGNAIALANQIVAASGRPLVIIPCAIGGSGIVEPQAAGIPYLIWDPAFPRGFGLRNSLMGSMVARTNDAIARGGKFRFLWWDQGQSDAESDVTHANGLVGATQSALTYFYTHTGLTERTIYAQMAATPHGANWALARSNQPALASASRIMVSEPDGPYEPDGVHDGPAAADVLGGLVANAALSAGW